MERSENRALLQGLGERLFQMVSNGATSTRWSKWLQPPLEQAVAEGDLDLVMTLLKAGADVKTGLKGSSGSTLLYAAAEGGNEKLMAALLEAGGRDDLNAVSGEDNVSALYHALSLGHTAVARSLMVAGARVDLRDNNKRTALHLAVTGGGRQLVEDVLIAGACVDAQTSFGRTALHLAADRGDCTMISTLLRAGASVAVANSKGHHALYTALQRGHMDATVALLKAGADPNYCFGTWKELSPLRIVSRNSAMTRLLLQYGARATTCDAHGCTPLHRAAKHGNSGVIDALIKAGAKVEAKTYNFENSTDGLVEEQTPLHRAAYFRSIPGMDALLRHGADIHAEEAAGWSPLHIVCASCSKQRSVQAVDFLLRRGADETATDNDGRTAKDLIEEGADSAERLERLLASAPADRAWRRRGLMVLCRAFPDRLKRGVLEGEIAKVLCEGEGIRTDADAARGDEEERVLVRVVKVEAEAIFRNIVGFL